MSIDLDEARLGMDVSIRLWAGWLRGGTFCGDGLVEGMGLDEVWLLVDGGHGVR
jgi:hypothetical protein